MCFVNFTKCGRDTIRKVCCWLLLLACLNSEVQAQQKIVFIKSETDVVEGCVQVTLPEGQGKVLMAPLVPSGTSTKPDIYSMTFLVNGTNRVRNLVFTFDRADQYVGYDEVVLGDGRVLPNPYFQQLPAAGRFGESHLLGVSDPTYEKIQKEGMKLKWRKKGKSGSTSFDIPAYFFSGFNKRVEQMLGTAPAVAKADTTPASPYMRSGSIGASGKGEVKAKLFENELSHLKEAELIGQEFIFMPLPPSWQKDGYSFGPEEEVRNRYPYVKYAGQSVKIVSVNTGPGGRLFFGGQMAGSGELIQMSGDVEGAILHNLALKRDVDFAREKFIGKKLWLNQRRVYTYDEANEENVLHLKRRFEGVTVKDVVLGMLGAPVRFIIEDAAGREFFVDVYMSRSNTQGSTPNLFDLFFETADPRKKLSWPDDIFEAVSLDQVIVGMNKTHVRIAWGAPISVTTTVTDNIKYEQWEYPNAVVAFTNEKCSSVQTLK